MSAVTALTSIALGTLVPDRLMRRMVAEVAEVAEVPRTASAAELDPRRSASIARTVSVIIPARDEEASLPFLLADLALQTVTPHQVLVIDDDSVDETAAAAKAHHVEVIPAGPRSSGWNPKVWAMHVGSRSATGEVLLFLDADVRMRPPAIASLLAALERDGGLVSVAPGHDAPLPVEALSAPANIIMVAAGRPLAVGSCIAIANEDYCRIGGHAAKPATLVDDIDLARTAHEHDVATRLYRGVNEITVRSYPEGLAQIADGWTKNLAAGAGASPRRDAAVAALWVASGLVPLVEVLSGRTAIGVSRWILTSILFRSLAARVGRFDPLVTTGAAPLLFAAFSGLFTRSLWYRISGRSVRWRGRMLDRSGREVAS